MIERTTVGGKAVRLVALPVCNTAALAAWERFTASDSIFGLDVESTAIGELGPVDPSMKERLVQFGTATEGWALDPTHPVWRERIEALLRDETKRFVSHNAAFDTTRVRFEHGVVLGDRSIDTLPMASLLWPGRTAPKGLKELCAVHIDPGLQEAERWLHGRFVDLFYANKPRKTALLPKGFEPGVSTCRQTKKRNEPKCVEVSMPESLCGMCEKHYLARKCGKDIETWGWNNIALDDPVFLHYGGLDAVYVRQLLDVLDALLRAEKMSRLSRTEQKVKRYMTGVSFRGMRVDREWTEGVLSEVEADFADAESRVWEATGLKSRSSYMQAWLRDHGAKRVTSLDKKHLPTLIEHYGNDEVLGPVLHALEDVSLHANLLTNLRTTYRHAVGGDGFVHPNINTLQAHTGRMSITKPAMQTFSKTGEKGRRLRGCYIAREGYTLVGADYDSQEICIGAALSRDPALLRIVNEGLNQHVLTAESIFPDFVDKKTNPDLYHIAKTLDFALQFGAFPRKVAATLGMPLAQATVLWQKWRATYAGLVKWSEQQSRKRNVRNPFGRVIPRDPHRDYANGNYLIQSTGRDVLGAAMVRLADAGWSDYFWLPIHDELVLEVPDAMVEQACEALTEHMSTTVEGIKINATGEVVGKRWKGLG
jgi:DNA polymerase I